MFDLISPIYFIVQIFVLLRCYAAQIGTYLRPFRGNLSDPSSRVNQAVPSGLNRLSENSYGSHLTTVLRRIRVFTGVTASFGECNPTFRSIGYWVFVVKVKTKSRKSITQKKTRQMPQYPNPCSSPYS